MVRLSKLRLHVFPPKTNACVLCIQVLCQIRRSFIPSFSRLSWDKSYLRTGIKGCSVLDEIFRLYRKFVSYLRPVSRKTRLIFPRIIGLLSSYASQILLQIHANLFCPQPVCIIARKCATRLVPHTAARLNKFLLYGTVAINTRIMSNYL